MYLRWFDAERIAGPGIRLALWVAFALYVVALFCFVMAGLTALHVVGATWAELTASGRR